MTVFLSALVQCKLYRPAGGSVRPAVPGIKPQPFLLVAVTPRRIICAGRWYATCFSLGRHKSPTHLLPLPPLNGPPDPLAVPFPEGPAHMGASLSLTLLQP